MSILKVKVCGVVNTEIAMACVKYGVDAIGLNFCPTSDRYLSIDIARYISQMVPAMTTIVGVFCNPMAEEVDRVLRSVPLDHLQFHGTETEEFCSQFNRTYIKAIPVNISTDWRELENNYKTARAFLFDSEGGGTGTSFEWRSIPKSFSRPWLLAGGLSANNVDQALSTVSSGKNFIGIDVSSGVEVKRGVKDKVKILEFMAAFKDYQRRSFKISGF